MKTTFASGLAVSGSACAGTREQVASTPPLDDDELEHKLARLDKTLARIEGETAKRWFLREHEAELAQLEHGRQRTDALELEQHLTHEGALLRASMRTALLVSSVAELPEKNQSDPRVVERVMRASDEADYALFGNLELLRNLSPEQLAELDAELTNETGPGMDIASRLDALSAELGVPTRRRLHLRRMAMHIDWRLQQERFSALIADVVGQVDRMVDSIRRGNAGELAFVGPDPAWAARTHEIVAFYRSPPPLPEESTPAPTDAPPVAPPVAESSPPVAPPVSPPIPPPPPISSPTPVQPVPDAATSAEADEWQLQRRKQQQEASAARRKAQEKLDEGKTMLGVGAGLLVVGGIAAGVGLGVGAATGGVGLFVMAIVGAVALTVGIILLIVGAVVAGKARRKLKRL